MSAELALFPVCPMANCKNPVDDPREPCTPCQELFGASLRPADRPAPGAAEFAEAAAEADARVAAILAERRAFVPLPEPAEVEWKPGQACWVCEERRKCRRDPDHPDRWICKSCETIT